LLLAGLRFAHAALEIVVIVAAAISPAGALHLLGRGSRSSLLRRSLDAVLPTTTIAAAAIARVALATIVAAAVEIASTITPAIAIVAAAIAAFLLRRSSAAGASEGGGCANKQRRGAEGDEQVGFLGHGHAYAPVTLNLR
jgi:hypothetical protein